MKRKRRAGTVRRKESVSYKKTGPKYQPPKICSRCGKEPVANYRSKFCVVCKDIVISEATALYHKRKREEAKRKK